MFFLRDYALPVTLAFDVRMNNALRAAMTTWFQQLLAIMVRRFPRDPLSRFIYISGTDLHVASYVCAYANLHCREATFLSRGYVSVSRLRFCLETTCLEATFLSRGNVYVSRLFIVSRLSFCLVATFLSRGFLSVSRLRVSRQRFCLCFGPEAMFLSRGYVSVLRPCFSFEAKFLY